MVITLHPIYFLEKQFILLLPISALAPSLPHIRLFLHIANIMKYLFGQGNLSTEDGSFQF